jgi:hypothetical protein
MKCPYCSETVSGELECFECGTAWLPDRPQQLSVPDSARKLMATRWLTAFGRAHEAQQTAAAIDAR